MPMKINCDKNIIPIECIRTKSISLLLTRLQHQNILSTIFCLEKLKKSLSTRNMYFPRITN